MIFSRGAAKPAKRLYRQIRILVAFGAIGIFLFVQTFPLPRARALYNQLSQDNSLSAFINALGDNGSTADKVVAVSGVVKGPLWTFIEDCQDPNGGHFADNPHHLVFGASLSGVSATGGVVSSATLSISTSGSAGQDATCGFNRPVIDPVNFVYNFSATIDVSGLSDSNGQGQVYSFTASFSSPSGGIQIPPEFVSDTASFVVKHQSQSLSSTCTIRVRGILNGNTANTGAAYYISGPTLVQGFDNGNSTFTVPGDSSYQLSIVSGDLQINGFASTPNGGSAGMCTGPGSQSLDLSVPYITKPVLNIR